MTGKTAIDPSQGRLPAQSPRIMCSGGQKSVGRQGGLYGIYMAAVARSLSNLYAAIASLHVQPATPSWFRAAATAASESLIQD